MPMKSESEIKSVVKTYLMDKFYFDFGVGHYSEDTDLFEAGEIDSLGFVNLVMFLENDFDLKFDISNLNPETFKTVNVISEFIRTRLLERADA